MAGINELKQRVENDEAFRGSLKGSESFEELLAKITYAGFDVMPEELADTMKSADEGELDDSELDDISGGSWNSFWRSITKGFSEAYRGIKKEIVKPIYDNTFKILF